MTDAIIVTGGGGVGKTTVSAALAAAAAAAGRETLVMTVDPARRLAGALGIAGIGNDPVPTGTPRLSAAMLDAAESWESIVADTAKPDVAARLRASPFFRAVADRFPAGQSYAAGAQMAKRLEAGVWDLVVVDTPPAAGGIDFFLAPGQMRNLVGGRLLRWGTGGWLPGRRRLYSVTARPVLRLADNILGGPLLEDVAEFLLDLRSIYDGLTARARQIERHLRQATTLVVTTADPAPLREAARFFRDLPEVAGPPAAIVFNRALPLEWAAPHGLPAGVGGRRGAALAANLERWGAEAQRQRDAEEEFAARFGVTPATIPLLAEPPTDVASLGALAEDVPRLAALARGAAGRG